MILVVGLGNPGPRYANTRHNVGAMAVDCLSRRASAGWQEGFHGRFARALVSGERLGLLIPRTYMNESGRSVRAAAQYFRIPPEAVVVAHDELDLPLGGLRLKQGGGEAGHRGLRSVSTELGSGDYVRVRMGIGRPGPNFEGEIADYVLEAFPLADRPVVDDLVEQAADAVELVACKGLQAAMNRVNQRKKTD